MHANIGFGRRLAVGAAFLAGVGAALTLEAGVTISSLTPATGVEVTNGVPVTVTAHLSTNDGSVVESVELAYAWNGGDWNTQTMSAVSGTNYTATIPPAVSSLTFYVTCRYDTTGVALSVTNAVSTKLPDYVRYADRQLESLTPQDYRWVPTASGPPYTNWVYTIGATEWVAEDCDVSTTLAEQPPGGFSRYFRLRSLNANVPFIRTPKLVEGVGTIYFTSMIKDVGYGAQLAVQYTTTNTLPADWRTADLWQTATNIVYPNGTDIRELVAVPIILNNREIRYVRFLRTDNGTTSGGGLPASATAGTINIDSIAISRPPTDVTITKMLQNPGYPSQDQEVRVRCQVNDVDSAIPSVNRRVTVTHSWGQTNLVPLGGGVYEGVIPRHGAGTNSYYFACDFDGYSYSRDPDGSGGAQTKRDERIGRAELKQFEYGVRPFRSDVQIMRIVTNAPSGAIDMGLVGENVWQGVVPNAASGTQSWTFVAINGYTNDASEYDPTPWEWGDVNQSAPYDIPINDFAERGVVNSIKATGIADSVMVRMNRQTGEYIVSADDLAIWNVIPVSGASIAVGQAFTVGADVTPLLAEDVEIVSVWMVYTWGGGSVITNRMDASPSVTNRYEAVIPRLPIGALTNYVISVYTVGGVTNTLESQRITYTLSDALDASRFTDFRAATWTPEDPVQTNYTYQVGEATSTWWFAAMCKYPVTNASALPPGSVSPALGIRATNDAAFVQSPRLDEGVGAVYFTSIMSDAGAGGQLEVQYTTNSAPEAWQTATTLVYAASAGYRATNATPVTLNDRAIRYVRFVRKDNGTNWNSGLITIDDITISPPPTQVTITELLHNPGYPASNQAVTVRCRVDDVDAGNPSRDRQVKAYYCWGSTNGPWTQTNMNLMAGGFYEGTLPQAATGTMHYYFACNYDGYFYSHDPDGLAGPQPAHDEATALNPALLKGLSYGIRAYRSDVNGMQVIPREALPTVDMQLVGDYLWRGRVPIQGITSVGWTFAGAAGYTNNAAGYAAAPWTWGDNVTPPNPTNRPFNGIAERDVTTNIVIAGLTDGLLTITVNSTNGSYNAAIQTYVTLQILTPASGAGLTNGAPVSFIAQLTTSGVSIVAGSVQLTYAWNGGEWITQVMTATAGTNLYTATIPPAVNTLSYFVTWRYLLEGETYVGGAPGASNAVSSILLDYVRYADRDQENLTPQDYKWVPTASGPPYTNWVYRIGATEWVAEDCDSNTDGSGMPPGGATRYFRLRSLNANVPFIRTPKLVEGVGTIYFTSMIKDVGYGAQLAVQYTTTNTLPADWRTADIWQTATNIVYPRNTGIKELVAAPIILNNREIRYVRFLRTDNGVKPDGYLPKLPTDGTINIDNIYISRPPTGVTLAEKLYNPGYPAQDQDVKVRCQVSDVDTNVPSVNRRVKVWYSWQSESGPWTQTNMVPISADVYEGVIPPHGAGRMAYWFQCDFDGYFFSRDPDGAGPQGTYSEEVGTAALVEKGEDDYRNYEIRRFRSDVQMMRVVSTNAPLASVDMDLVGDHVWQGLTLVSGITNLTWTFVGSQGYDIDAADYDPTPWSWGDNDQDFPYPPVAGIAERSATNTIKAELEYNGFLLMRVDRQTGEYIVKRAVYQKFDVWPASQTDFEESLGLYAIQTFKQDFSTNAWRYGFDAYSPGRYQSEPVDTTPVTGFVRGSPALTQNWWAFDYARVVKERNAFPSGVLTVRRAIELDGGTSRGHVWNTYASKTLGIENFTFDARLSLNDTRFSYFKGTPTLNPFVETPTNWPKHYRAEATFRASSLSPGLGSISLLTWIAPSEDLLEPPSYYETRLTQGDSTAQNEDRINIGVYRWKGGVPVQVGATQTKQVGVGYSLENWKTVRVEMTNTAAEVSLTVRVDTLGGTNFNWTPAPVFADTSADRLTEIGTVGFISYDAQLAVSRLNVMNYQTLDNQLPGENWGSGTGSGLTTANWYMGGKRADNQDRWRISGDALVRDIPSQTLGLYTYPMPEGVNWQPDFTVRKKIGEVTVSALGYTPFSLPLKVWDAKFVEIKNEATGEINAVLDELALSPWRAVTRSDKTLPNTEETVDGVLYYNWTSTAEQEAWVEKNGNEGWLVLGGWLNTSAGSKGGEAQFDRSRVNTNLVQALVSPYLTNNIGSIAFDWRANGVSNVVFAIERTVENNYPSWQPTPVLIVTNNVLSGTVNFSIRTDFPGRIRVRVREGTSSNAVFKIDNLVVRDYPPRDDTTWQAYNALITEAQPSRAFEPTKPGAQTAFLNNDPTNGVALSEVLDQYQPFIQTPKVGTGIGEISFWYRIWDTNGGPANILLKVAPDENTPEGQWKELTNIVVASTQTDYIYFSNDAIYEPDNKVLRIVCSTNGNRVGIDDVLMTEPVRSGFEFMAVRLLPEQPLVGKPPGVEVEIGRFIKNPSNIQVYVSYYVGTNTWGYTNWWSTAYPNVVELTNNPGAPRVFQTPDNVVLPAGAVDDVVQFFVWGVHGDIDIEKGDRPILQGTNSFVNPPWYYPADLNAVTPKEPGLAAFGSRGWSPYYYVYSCPPGSVWVNELRYFYWDWWELDAEFFEIIGPAEASLGRWQLQMMNTENTVVKESVIPQDFVLKNATNGWGFLLWGDDAMSSYGDHILFPDWVAGRDDIPQAGGVRVVRSNGAWEDRVAWGYGSDSLISQYGYTYAGARDSEYTLSMRSVSTNLGSKASEFSWGTVEGTPNAVNKFQRLLDNSEIPISFFMIYSAIGPNGSHSLGTNPGTIEVAVGASTNIVYTANPWYRIGTLQTNGVAVGAAQGLTVYTQAHVNVRSAYSNQVTFTHANWTQTGLTNAVPVTWASQYYPTNEAGATGNVNIARDYLLEISPTNSHTIAFAIESIVVSNTVTVTVKLTDAGNPLQTQINGAVKLYGKPTLITPTWSGVGAATVSNANFNVDGKYTLPAFPTHTNTFFKAVIE